MFMPDKEISEDQAQFFFDNGYLIIRGVLHPEELSGVQSAMLELMENAPGKLINPDYAYGKSTLTGDPILTRIDYVIEKRDVMKSLLGHPYILGSTERLMGSDLIPTWDSMVLKFPGEGVIVPWHRDAGADQVGDKPIFNVDFYLDEATEQNCVWVIPESQKWSTNAANAWLAQHSKQDTTPEQFRASGAIPVTMAPGDVLFHDILVLHGSPTTFAKSMRRVVYYEFRTAHVEDSIGPHIADYIPLKQKVLLACIKHRMKEAYAQAETPFSYNPPSPYDKVTLRENESLESYRYTHEKYWRK